MDPLPHMDAVTDHETDSPAARGASPGEADDKPRSSIDLARRLFAQVFSGVHW